MAIVGGLDWIRVGAGGGAACGLTSFRRSRRTLRRKSSSRAVRSRAHRTSLRDSARVLAGLARRHRLGVVSNFYGNLGAVCAGAGLAPVLGVITDSSAVGWSKPDPRIFRHALDALGVSPEDAAFVGDSRPRDMEGARALAMPHVWLVDADAPPAPPCCPGDPVISSLDELDAVLA